MKANPSTCIVGLRRPRVGGPQGGSLPGWPGRLRESSRGERLDPIGPGTAATARDRPRPAIRPDGDQSGGFRNEPGGRRADRVLEYPALDVEEARLQVNAEQMQSRCSGRSPSYPSWSAPTAVRNTPSGIPRRSGRHPSPSGTRSSFRTKRRASSSRTSRASRRSFSPRTRPLHEPPAPMLPRIDGFASVELPLLPDRRPGLVRWSEGRPDAMWPYAPREYRFDLLDEVIDDESGRVCPAFSASPPLPSDSLTRLSEALSRISGTDDPRMVPSLAVPARKQGDPTLVA